MTNGIERYIFIIRHFKFFGKYHPVKAEIHLIESLSAHGDQNDLLNWLSELKPKPQKVFLVNGDSHRFITDKPILINDQKSTLMNFTRIQVFGDAEMAAIKITYDPKSTTLFQVEQMLID